MQANQINSLQSPEIIINLSPEPRPKFPPIDLNPTFMIYHKKINQLVAARMSGNFTQIAEELTVRFCYSIFLEVCAKDLTKALSQLEETRQLAQTAGNSLEVVIKCDRLMDKIKNQMSTQH